VEVTRKQLLRGLGVAGAAAVLDVEPVAASVSRTREHWVAAVPTMWNIIPNGRDAISKRTFTGSESVIQTVVYREFTRGWRKPLRQPRESGLAAGIPGPLLRARVGDSVVVHFKNMDTAFHRPHSMHFHGVHYEFGSDGAFIPGFSGRGGDVKPGQSYTYRLKALADSVGVWPYHDHSPSMHESIIGGLYGALSILPAGQPRPDREFVVFFAPMLDFMAINGRAFIGNTPVFRAKIGDVVQWDVLTLGDDFHTFHIHGHRWQAADGTFVDTRTVGPAESFAVRFREDVPGAWLYHCHVETHMANGMIGLYNVRR
jgi:FtsP/CotA-like multicopper oxidase with cupredoxin domain